MMSPAANDGRTKAEYRLSAGPHLGCPPAGHAGYLNGYGNTLSAGTKE